MNIFQDRTLAPVAPGLSHKHRRAWIHEGTRGTEETIALMQELASRGKRDITVRAAVGRILNGQIDGIPECPPKDYLCYAKAIYTFCRDKIKYAYDPHLVEYLEEPAVILTQTGIADCDSICVLMASMLENVGLETQYVTIKADPKRPDEFSHVYLRVKVPRKGWYVCDATMPTKHFGWEAPGDYAKRYWPGSSDTRDQPLDTKESERVMSGMGDLLTTCCSEIQAGHDVPSSCGKYLGPSWGANCPTYSPTPVILPSTGVLPPSYSSNIPDLPCYQKMGKWKRQCCNTQCQGLGRKLRRTCQKNCISAKSLSGLDAVAALDWQSLALAAGIGAAVGYMVKGKKWLVIGAALGAAAMFVKGKL